MDIKTQTVVKANLLELYKTFYERKIKKLDDLEKSELFEEFKLLARENIFEESERKAIELLHIQCIFSESIEEWNHNEKIKREIESHRKNKEGI